MKTHLRKLPFAVLIRVLAMLMLAGLFGCPLAQAAEIPRLALEPLADSRVRLAWTNSGQRIVLEEATSLEAATPWLPSAETVTLDGSVYSMVLGFGGTTRFYRLRDVGPLLTTFASSPASGESGVATTRETILQFNQPLAADTLLTSSNLYAEFGGRRILSRVELSSDRRKATLFYLENLPASARIHVTFDAQDVRDIFGRLVDADRDLVEGGVGELEFDTLSITPVPGTAIIGHVFASQLAPNPTNAAQSINVPLAGVTITVDGAEETLRTTTDASGFFRLQPCPAGRFFVHVDGRTVTNVAAGLRYPDLAYYPSVGKAWEAAAGYTNNLAAGTGQIFLPLIRAGTLQPVSVTEDTIITFPPEVIAANPALNGVQITVPANSLFSDNGARGGKIGLAPVPPDRLPEPLPAGFNLPLVITIQSDGPGNFDRPVPVRFPNLPDPTTGQPLPAGAKSALMSFNHDLGFWEIVGPMTVSLDGRFVVSDPGVGVRQPGWHGTFPASRVLPPLRCCSHYHYSGNRGHSGGGSGGGGSGGGGFGGGSGGGFGGAPGIRPNTNHAIAYYDPQARTYGSAPFISAGPGADTTLPEVIMSSIDGLPDADSDGLPDVVELIIGTNSNLPDTDGDGISDGAEIEQGTNPLDGRPVRTGVLASVDTSGTALDVAALNNVAVVAIGAGGVVVLDASNPFQPVRAAVVPTVAPATAVAVSGNFVAVAQGSAGLAVLDITTPGTARKLYDLSVGSAARAVAARGATAFVGSGNSVVIVDMPTGRILERIPTPAAVDDLDVRGGYLFVAVGTELRSYLLGEHVSFASSAPLGFFPEPRVGRRRLSVGITHAFVASYPGYDSIDIRDPAALARVGTVQDVGPNSFRQIVDNGSGLGVAAVGVGANDGDVYLYDITSPVNTTSFLTSLPTPGIAHAVSIFNGLAYVADGSAGLQVLNYLAYDALGVPPTITLSNSFALSSPTNGLIEGGQVFTASASVTDDVQVRNVEFYVDGQLVVTDGNFPFEQALVAPQFTASKTNFTVRAKATDTGGNFTFTPEILVQLVLDATGPRIVSRFPQKNDFQGAVDTILVRFNEPLNPASLSAAGFFLTWAGNDGLLGTGDDGLMTDGALAYRATDRVVTLGFASGLATGLYRMTDGSPLADLSGNVATTESWTFFVLGTADADQDGVPDAVESLLGLNPNNPDTDGDGVMDGDEDLDGDGLPTRWELAYGYDPLQPDSDNNGFPDGNEEPDGDGLKNHAELAAGTNPRIADTDGDGWNDEAEVTGGSSPLNPTSQPRHGLVAQPPVRVIAPALGSTDGLPLNTFVAQPPVRVIAPALGSPDGLPFNCVIAAPPIQVTFDQP